MIHGNNGGKWKIGNAFELFAVSQNRSQANFKSQARACETRSFHLCVGKSKPIRRLHGYWNGPIIR